LNLKAFIVKDADHDKGRIEALGGGHWEKGWRVERNKTDWSLSSDRKNGWAFAFAHQL